MHYSIKFEEIVKGELNIIRKKNLRIRRSQKIYQSYLN